jgi:hypothetical protein
MPVLFVFRTKLHTTVEVTGLAHASILSDMHPGAPR